MTIDNPNEFTALVAKNEELAAKIVEFEAMAEQFETLKKDSAETTNEVEALRAENAELKEAVAANAEVGEQIKAEVEKNVELTETKNGLVETLIAKDNEIAQLKEKAAAFEELSSEYAEEVETVQGQFALLKSHLGKRGQVPDIEDAPVSNKTSAAYETWLRLSNSKDPNDRIAARRMKKDNPDIEAQIAKNAAVATAPAVIPTQQSNMTPEQLAVFTEWKTARNMAKEYQTSKQYKLHAEKTTEARRLYNKDNNKATIDACLAAGM